MFFSDPLPYVFTMILFTMISLQYNFITYLQWWPRICLLFRAHQICNSDILLEISFCKTPQFSFSPWYLEMFWWFNFHPYIWRCFGDFIFTLIFGDVLVISFSPWYLEMFGWFYFHPDIWRCLGDFIFTLIFKDVLVISFLPWYLEMFWWSLSSSSSNVVLTW